MNYPNNYMSLHNYLINIFVATNGEMWIFSDIQGKKRVNQIAKQPMTIIHHTNYYSQIYDARSMELKHFNKTNKEIQVV